MDAAGARARDRAAVAAAGASDGDGRRERLKAAVYGAIDEVGRGEIAGALRGGASAAGLGGPVVRAVRIAAARAGLPDPRGCSGLPDPGAAATVLTVLLHYLLSAASVPSQRAVRVGGVDIDIAVPDAAGPPEATVAVCIAGDAGGGLGGEAELTAAAVAGALRLPRDRVWTAAWMCTPAPSAAGGPCGVGSPASSCPQPPAPPTAGRTYLASDGSLGMLVPDLAAFAASPEAAARGGQGRGGGRRLSLSGIAARM